MKIRILTATPQKADFKLLTWAAGKPGPRYRSRKMRFAGELKALRFYAL
jgi:hypothetical protein